MIGKDYAVFYIKADEDCLIAYYFDENLTLNQPDFPEEYAGFGAALCKFGKEQELEKY